MSNHMFIQLLKDICDKNPQQIEASLQCIEYEKRKTEAYLVELEKLKNTLLHKKHLETNSLTDESFLFKWGC